MSSVKVVLSRLSLSVLLIICGQIFTSAQMSLSAIQKTLLRDVVASVKDADTGEDICYASVYLTTTKDSTIVSFTLSDGKGIATLTKVSLGEYILYAEMVGYEPYAKKIQVTAPNGFDRILDLGKIKMKQSAEMLSAAKVSAAAAPMVIKQDTVVYNAAAYKVAENAKLGDLLSKMPGMEVKNGSVKVNGEQVKNITIGGRTFFLNDPSVALSNIPAKIVENVKVFEEAKDEAKFSGIVSQNDKQTVMDVGLKAEYQEGFFGNAEIAGGWEDEFLSKSSLFASAYSPEDMLSIVANASNVEDPMDPTIAVFRAGEVLPLSGRNGVTESVLVGANLNTSRVKKFDTDFSTKYRFNKLSVADTVRQESFTQNEDLFTDELMDGASRSNNITSTLLLKKKNSRKLMLHMSLTGSFSDNDESSTNVGNTNSSLGSHSESVTLSGNNGRSVRGSANVLTRYNFSKARRALLATATIAGSHSKGGGYDDVNIDYGTDVYRQSLTYDKRSSSSSFNTRIAYEEPLADKLLLQISVDSRFSSNKTDKDASSDYYNTHSISKHSNIIETATVQYRDKNNTATVGFSVDENQDKTETEKYGQRGGDWQTNVAPRIQFMRKLGNGSLNLNYAGRTQQPSNSQMNPGLDFSDPTQAQIGNAGLKSAFAQSLSGIYRYNYRPKQILFSVQGSLHTTSNQISHAVWYDSKGLRFALPVNLDAPSVGYSFFSLLSMPLDKARHFTLNLNPSAEYNISRSLQPKGRLDVIDTDSFNYDDFLEWFNSSDDFLRSKTNSLSLYYNGDLKYSNDRLTITAGASAHNRIAKYSVNREANIKTWDDSFHSSILYSLPNEVEIYTQLRYSMYRGYSEGMGDPKLLWNARVSKKFKYCTFSIKGIDLLDQQRRLSKTISSTSIREVCSNIRGRMFLVGVSFDFGKLNAGKNAKAQETYSEINLF